MNVTIGGLTIEVPDDMSMQITDRFIRITHIFRDEPIKVPSDPPELPRPTHPGMHTVDTKVLPRDFRKWVLDLIDERGTAYAFGISMMLKERMAITRLAYPLSYRIKKELSRMEAEGIIKNLKQSGTALYTRQQQPVHVEGLT